MATLNQAFQLTSLLTETIAEEFSLVSYKAKLEACLRDALELCRSPVAQRDSVVADAIRIASRDNVVTFISVAYDPQLLRKFLSSSVPWTQLCRGCDDLIKTRKDTDIRNADSPTEEASVLFIFINCLLNPTVWPSCCSMVVLECLIEVWISQPTSTKPWRRYLLDTVITDQLLQRNPSLQRNVGQVLKTWVTNASTVEQGRALLMVVVRWHYEFPLLRVVCLARLLELLAFCDRLEQQLQQSSHRQRQQQRPTATRTRTQCNRSCTDDPLKGSRRERSTGFSIQYLHNEMSEEEEEALAKKVARTQQPRSSPAQSIRLKDVLQEGSNCINGDCDSHSFRVQTLLELWKLKACCATNFLDMCRATERFWSTGSALPRCVRPVEALLQLLLDVAVQETYAFSTSIRLCAVLLLHGESTASTVGRLRSAVLDNITGKASLQELLDFVRSKAVSGVPGDSASLFYFRFSIELVCECSHFDNLNCLKRYVAPLFIHLHTITTAANLMAPTSCPMEQVKSPNGISVKPLLQCFAYFLTRRGAMLLSAQTSATKHDVFYRGFTSLVQHLSLLFDSTSHWIDPAEPLVERAQKMEILQAMGILGMSASDEDDTRSTQSIDWCAGNNNIRKAAECLDAWMDVEFFSKAQPILNGRRQIPLFSLYSTTNAIPPSLSEAHAAARRAATHSPREHPRGAVGPEELDDYMLQHIFSFLNYRKVVGIRAVCSSWKENADAKQLWQSLYHAKYGIRSDDPLIQTPKRDGIGLAQDPSLHHDWKKLFINRWHASRDIRFRYSRTNPTWKVRICAFVGCLHVLSSPIRLKKHYKLHTQKQTENKAVTTRTDSAHSRKRKRSKEGRAAKNST